MNPLTSPLLTDLYQLTMLQAYLNSGIRQQAAFEFFVRTLPENRNFLTACGLETFLDYLEGMRFSPTELIYMKGTGRFSSDLIDYLEQFQFTGDVYAMPEGTVFFTDEPIIRVVAPICEAQLVETRLINMVQFETLIASKAARCVIAADGRASLIDFGVRRAHGAEAGLLAARASYIAGFIGTSTVLANAFYGIPIFGTMAHSFIEAHDSEEAAFIDFCLANPQNTTLLIDTYDTPNGCRKAVEVAKILAEKGIRVQRVRLDSGDILALSKEVRQILDQAGYRDIEIFVSGNMDEFIIEDLLTSGAPINGFGVGTKMDTSADAPYLECAYKLTEYADRPRMKKSSGKVSLPGRKQVFRSYEKGRMTGDVITVEGDSLAGTPLIEQVMVGGNRLAKPRTLQETAAYTRDQFNALPRDLRALRTAPAAYPVALSPSLNRLKAKIETSLDR
ncbi:MAG: nicotinate phosphoribosyltransferase [Deltaproteobacteria bacterium]|nr:nicotinate phosphoribosyltransferase [Deltaproteobacteria bacterium]